MTPSHRLSKLHGAALKRVAKLRSRVDKLVIPASQNDEVQIAWTVMEAQNLWAGFLRAYYLSAAIHTRTNSGVKVRLTLAQFRDATSAMKAAIKIAKNVQVKKSTIKRRDEPPWHELGNFLKLANHFGVSNIAQIRAAVAAPSAFAKFLPPVRNFFAHRCDETSRKAAAVGVLLGLSSKPELRASRIMCSKLPKRPQNVITDWLDDMANVIDLLCS